MQVFVSLLMIGMADNAASIYTLITMFRQTRFVLTFIRLIDVIRRRVSDYHLVALSNLYRLITIPEYFICFEY